MATLQERADVQAVQGQFDDASDTELTPQMPAPSDPRAGRNFIDEEHLLEWSSDSNEGDEDHDRDEYDAFDAEEDELETSAFQDLRPEDEDWEIAERDFTKQYNRVKQHVAVRTGAAQGVASATNARATVAALPAVNRPRMQKNASTAPSAKSSSHTSDKTASQLEALAKYTSRIRNIDMPYDLGVGVNRKGPSATANMKDKSDRATSEQVLDPRTRIILFKMIGRGLLYEINGCVSTGKEANVYHAVTPDGKHLALKIYKTSILVFKDRDKYVSGEYRFRRGYSRHNPRKMVRVWAEKEMRNLKRLRAAGILCPEPVEVRENVLVMGFIGDREGWASARLKDANVPPPLFTDLYVELLLTVRKLFHECRLVHADLSEYNILYYVDSPTQPETSADVSAEATRETSEPPRGHLYIIDVSQSVEHDHPHAFDFLRSDLRNVEDFFARRDVHCAGLRRAFEFVTRDSLAYDGRSDEEVLRAWMEEPEPEEIEDGKDGGEEKAKHEDEVFMRSYIPRTLNEVYDPERDVGALTRGEGEKLIYKDTIGIVAPNETDTKATVSARAEKGGVRFQQDELDEGEQDDVDSDASDSEGSTSVPDEEDGEGQAASKERPSRGHRHEDKDAKKERKKAAKDEAREKRKHKIPKAEKKRKIKATARRG